MPTDKAVLQMSFGNDALLNDKAQDDSKKAKFQKFS
jgi:hypothetical protein